MKIYTGFGDKGNTSLFGGEVVRKSHLRVELYGTLDELNSVIGILKLKITDSLSNLLMVQIQEDLFIMSSEIATPDLEKQQHFNRMIQVEEIKNLEKEIDRMDQDLTELKNFILPGGSEAAAFAHLARTVTRRAERILNSLSDIADIRGELGIYLNRLSDLFFVFARFQNRQNGVKDVIWQGIHRKGKSSTNNE